MVSISQIKAARALLNWKQADLAAISGVSVPAIAKIESGQGNPRQTTMTLLQNAFEKSGIDFLGEHGVDQRQERFSIETLYGRDALYKIMDDINQVCFETKTELLLSNLDERVFMKLYGKQMKPILQKRQSLNIATRALVKEGETYFLMPLEWHRTVPKILFAQVVYYVYGDKMVVADFKESPRFIVIESASLSNAFRQQFNYNWDNGKRIDPKKATLWKL